MKHRIVLLALVLALVSGFAFAPAGVARAQLGDPFQNIDVEGTIVGGGAFNGVLDITRFAVQGGQLVAIGSLTGTLTDVLGNVIGTVTNFPVAIPVTEINAVCEILDLTLGPLNLDLLGLVVDLSRIDLEITAESGPGNLLGNLLCGIAGLLDSNASLNVIARLLNNLLRLF